MWFNCGSTIVEFQLSSHMASEYLKKRKKKKNYMKPLYCFDPNPLLLFLVGDLSQSNRRMTFICVISSVLCPVVYVLHTNTKKKTSFEFCVNTNLNKFQHTMHFFFPPNFPSSSIRILSQILNRFIAVSFSYLSRFYVWQQGLSCLHSLYTRFSCRPQRGFSPRAVRPTSLSSLLVATSTRTMIRAPD